MENASRLVSGINGLDTILSGGLVCGSSYIIQGEPGAGKTILSNQIAFTHAANGGRVLYVTLLSESHERLFLALEAMAFFDREKLGQSVTYLSVFQTLRDEGLDAVVKLLRQETKRQKATLLIFDGLLNARDRADSAFDVKSFVAEVQGQAAFVGCTVLFLASIAGHEVSPEHTMVDGVIELTDRLAGVRAVRQLQVRKSRGSKAIGGLHKFEISDDGITVYPRLETIPTPSSAAELQSDGRLGSGIPSLDGLISGGFPSGSVTLISGPSGSGKTSLGLHFLSQCTPTEPGLHFGSFETPERLRQKAAALGLSLPNTPQALGIDWISFGDNILDKLGYALLKRVEQTGTKRLLIDGLNTFERAAIHHPRLIDFFANLMERLRFLGVTTLATWDFCEPVVPDVASPMRGLSAVLDNLIHLRLEEEDHRLVRIISVRKMRDGDFDPNAHELDFTDRGLAVGRQLNRGV